MRWTRRVPLASTKIKSSLEYESESETNTSSALFLLPPLTPPPLSSSILPTSPYNMSRHNINLEQIIQQQQKQLVAMQTQIQMLLAAGRREGEVAPRPNTESNIEVAKPQVFDGSQEKILRFIIVYRLYIIMKMREEAVEEQI